MLWAALLDTVPKEYVEEAMKIASDAWDLQQASACVLL
jgi:hypothetical protein